MATDPQQEAVGIFESALDVPAESRASWLRDKCGDNSELFNQVIALLELHREAGGLFPLQETDAWKHESGDDGVRESMALTPGARLGDFEIESRVGSGGMGVVYRARQLALNRTVALKVLPQHLRASPSIQKRFQAEVAAAAKLQHPNIVSVLTTGVESGIQYYAMDFIDGQTLGEVIRDLLRNPVAELADCPRTLPESRQGSAEAGTGKTVEAGVTELDKENLRENQPIERQSGWKQNLEAQTGYFDWVAQVIAEVADALNEAHIQNLVHRDVKPSNLLLGRDGIVLISDFGLARDLSQPGMTQSGEVLGTPYYMAPEQIKASSRVDHRADVYGLGATLYELLTLQPPFLGDSRDEVLVKIVQEQVVSPRRINARIPRDFETIILKALAKSPSDRYSSAQQLAADLRCFQAREPISARRPGWIERTFRWVERHRALAASLLALPICIAIVSTLFAIRNHGLVVQLQAQKVLTNENLFEAKLEQSRAIRNSIRPLRRTEALWAIDAARSLLPELQLNGPDRQLQELQLRNEAVAVLALPELAVGRTWTAKEPWAVEVAFSPDFQWIAQPARDGRIRVFSASGDQEVMLTGMKLPAKQMKFSPDGRYLASKHYNRSSQTEAIVCVWDLRQVPSSEIDRRILKLADRHIYLADFDFAHTRPEFACVMPGKGIDIYDLEDASLIQSLRWPDLSASLLSFASDDRLAVSSFRGKELRVHDPGEKRTLSKTLRIESNISALQWDLYSGRLGAGTSTGEIVVWPANLDSSPTIIQAQQRELASVHFQPAGSLIASQSVSENVRVTNLSNRTTQPVATDAERVHLSTAGFSQDGQKLGFIRLGEFGYWQAADSPLVVLGTETQPKPVTQVQFFPNHSGEILARSLLDGIEIWDLSRRERLQKLSVQRHLVFEFSPEGDSLYTASFKDGLSRFPVRLSKIDGRYRCEIGPREPLVEGFCTRLAIEAAGRRVAVIRQRPGSSYELQILSTESGEVITQVDNVPRLLCMEFSSDGSKIHGSHIRPPAISTWDIETGERTEKKEMAEGFLSSMSSQSNVLACRSDYEARFVDLGTWEEMLRLPMPKGGNKRSGASVSRGLAVVNLDDFISVLVNPSTGQELAHLEASPQDSIRFYDFSPDNRRLAVAANRNLQVWDLHKLQEMLTELGLNWTDKQ